jgi:hypothetical protein
MCNNRSLLGIVLGIVNKLFVFSSADPKQNMIEKTKSLCWMGAKKLNHFAEWAQKFTFFVCGSDSMKRNSGCFTFTCQMSISYANLKVFKYGNLIFNWLIRANPEYRAYKKGLYTDVSCLWNRGPLKVLNNTQFILNDQFCIVHNFQRSQTRNW